MEKRVYIVAINVVVLLFVFADSALAVQIHGGAEGLVAHQIGHLLFAVGMLYLLVSLRRMQFNKDGWFEFEMFLWLIVGWNVLTFTGHALNESADLVEFSIHSFSELLLYVSLLDHLLLVPSFVFLLLALRKWGKRV